MLARDIDNLAIVAGINHGNQLSPVPYAKYINENTNVNMISPSGVYNNHDKKFVKNYLKIRR